MHLLRVCPGASLSDWRRVEPEEQGAGFRATRLLDLDRTRLDTFYKQHGQNNKEPCGNSLKRQK